MNGKQSLGTRNVAAHQTFEGISLRYVALGLNGPTDKWLDPVWNLGFSYWELLWLSVGWGRFSIFSIRFDIIFLIRKQGRPGAATFSRSVGHRLLLQRRQRPRRSGFKYLESAKDGTRLDAQTAIVLIPWQFTADWVVFNCRHANQILFSVVVCSHNLHNCLSALLPAKKYTTRRVKNLSPLGHLSVGALKRQVY